jgi:hypothetical protein
MCKLQGQLIVAHWNSQRLDKFDFIVILGTRYCKNLTIVYIYIWCIFLEKTNLHMLCLFFI